MEILKGVEDDSKSLRYRVLSALVRLRPEEREAVLNREAQAVAAADESEGLAFAHWLSSLNEHKRLLAFLPSGIKWKDMSAEMALLKLEALAQVGHWDELSKAQNRDVEKVLGAVSFNLWQARILSAQGGGASRVHQHLKLAFDATGRGQDPQAAVQVAEAAEKLGAQDLAATFYAATADAQGASPQMRLELLEKAYALHHIAGDSYSMLQTAREVADLTPGNRANAFRADYLALLIGQSIEIVAARIAAASVPEDDELSSRLLFLKAMAAHRLHAPLQESGMLKTLLNLSWEPGQRAVLAAMLATCGDAATGFQMTEKIAASLLLPEEKKFLALAR